MNNFLRKFPLPNGKVAMVLSKDEILDLLKFGVPNSWQKQFLMHQFDLQAHKVVEFIKFCERIEATEDATDGRKNDKAQDTSKNKKADKKQKGKHKFNDNNKCNGNFVSSTAPGMIPTGANYWMPLKPSIFSVLLSVIS